MMSAHLSFFFPATIASTFDDVMGPMEEQFSKTVKSVAFPVFHSFSQLIDSSYALLFVYCLVCLLQNSGGHCNAFGDFCFLVFVQVSFIS
jgi:hypothetical protein